MLRINRKWYYRKGRFLYGGYASLSECLDAFLLHLTVIDTARSHREPQWEAA